MESLAARNSLLNREIDTQKVKISTLQSALTNDADSFGGNDKRTQNWQIQLNKATAELNGIERELGDNEKALDAVGKEEKEAGEVKESGKTTDDAGGRFDKLGGIFKGIGAAMGAAFIAVGADAMPPQEIRLNAIFFDSASFAAAFCFMSAFCLFLL